MHLIMYFIWVKHKEKRLIYFFDCYPKIYNLFLRFYLTASY